MLLNLDLSFTELLIELLQVLFGLEHLAILRDLLQGVRHYRVESFCFLDEKFLDTEQVPILPYRLQEIVEEVVELFAQVVSNENYVVPEIDFVLFEAFTNGALQDWLL